MGFDGHWCLAAGIINVGFAQAKAKERLTELKRQQVLRQIALDEQEITCLTNEVYHEAQGETAEVRKLLGQTVLAIIGDPTFKAPKTTCGLAKVPGFFSQMKDAAGAHFADSLWRTIYWEMNDVYNGSRALPRGWGCVRGFRVSDDRLLSLKAKALAQLGFTLNAKGLKYFATDRVPVDTRGDITFYSPRGGCRTPTQTF